ncbi:hypothetical protein FQZ97_863330 [compost metagenome]
MELSSSQVARIISGWRKGWSSSPRTASMASGKKPFMSQLPRPYQRPPTSLSFSGSVFHRAPSKGTVSLCPASTRPPGPLPSVARRLALPGAICWISQRKPRSPSQLARSSITAWLGWSQPGWVQLTEGVAISSANCDFRSGTDIGGLHERGTIIGPRPRSAKPLRQGRDLSCRLHGLGSHPLAAPERRRP